MVLKVLPQSDDGLLIYQWLLLSLFGNLNDGYTSVSIPSLSNLLKTSLVTSIHPNKNKL